MGIGAQNTVIVSQGFTYVPSYVEIDLGTSVQFQLSGSHDAREVSKQTYNANGSTSNGGFQVPFGGGLWTPTVADTFYYVCTPHAAGGMKGIVVVKDNSMSIANLNAALDFIYPNPIGNAITLTSDMVNLPFQWAIHDLHGKVSASGHGLPNIPLEFSAQELSAGIYFIQIHFGDQQHKVYKFVK